jgi:hypothetical protein
MILDPLWMRINHQNSMKMRRMMLNENITIHKYRYVMTLNIQIMFTMCQMVSKANSMKMRRMMLNENITIHKYRYVTTLSIQIMFMLCQMVSKANNLKFHFKPACIY